MSDLAAALMVAIRVHAGQVDKQGEPYLLHVLRVVEAVSDEAKPVAALHDVVEDAGTHLEGARLASECGLDGREFWALMALTRSEGEGTQCEGEGDGEGFYPHEYLRGYIQHIADTANPIAVEVKLADLRDNLGRIPAGDTKASAWEQDWASLKARYEKAVEVLCS